MKLVEYLQINGENFREKCEIRRFKCERQDRNDAFQTGILGRREKKIGKYCDWHHYVSITLKPPLIIPMFVLPLIAHF